MCGVRPRLDLNALVCRRERDSGTQFKYSISRISPLRFEEFGPRSSLGQPNEYVGREVGYGPITVQPHGQVGLGQYAAQNVFGALCAADGDAISVRTTDRHRCRSESE